jgi:phosphoglycolate phosphatase
LDYEYLIFDLDGTISDPKDGIVRSINYALESHGLDHHTEQELVNFIGPPLDMTFSTLSGSSDASLIASLVAKYRERYAEVGFSENKLYSGIIEILDRISAIEGINLGICTSKRVDFAEQILELFSLRDHFDFVSGGDVGIEKWQQLGALLNKGIINQKSIMIGDRYIDITAAHENNLQSAGVLWGYGSRSELSQHGPEHIFSSPNELMVLTK